METITPRLSNRQKKNLFILLGMGLAVFILSAFPNARGAKTEHMLWVLSRDESFQYPFLTAMLTPTGSLLESLKRFISYQHYIYGYPFYLVSTLAVLPSRLIFGGDFANQVQLNLLLLRQLVSVLPMLTALGFLTYLTTRLENTYKSVALFAFLVSVQGVTRQNLQWWHPDAFTFLMIVLTFFFLDRDQLRFGRHFYWAAVACGLAAATKVIGVFFFLAIPLYLVVGLRQRKINMKKAIRAAVLFVLLMVIVVVVTNPLLLVSHTRASIIAVHRAHSDEFYKGWGTGDQYQLGFLAWIPVLTAWYGQGAFLIFGAASLLLGCFWGRRKLLHWLILSWVLPYAVYIFYSIANKPDHYMLPVVLPMYACLFTLADLGHTNGQIGKGETKQVQPIPPRNFLKTILFADLTLAIVLLAMGGQFMHNLQRGQRLYREAMVAEPLVLSCNISPSNDLDGQRVHLDADKWYLVENFDNAAEPKVRHFLVVQGPAVVQATPGAGQQAWGCVSEARAMFSAQERAISFKYKNPGMQVFGPDGRQVH